MLILGHLGFSLAATKVGEGAYKRVSNRRFRSAAKLIDYRILAVGAMLPDIIDKPLATLVLTEALDGVTRNLGHTLLFSLSLFVIWAVVSRRRRNFLFPLAVGSGLHLLLDGMFSNPNTLLWPFLGWEFSEAGRVDELFSGLPIPWSLPWNVSWLAFSELVGSLFIVWALFGEWRERVGRVLRPSYRRSVSAQAQNPPVQ